jgi:hypothetical protein
MLFTADNLARLAADDLPTLARFDAQGILLGPGESGAQLAARVRQLASHIAELRQELSRDGKVDFQFTQFAAVDEIPPAVFAAARARTEELYGFSIDWVPGFYTQYRMGLLFAGCAFYSYEDYFALFILRRSFQARERWLIYSRTELMAHELCHIAHLGLNSRSYEEIFAYQTATSPFRRWVGGVLRTPRETAILMTTVLALLGAQCLNLALRPPERWHDFPMPQLFALAGLIIAGIVVQYLVALWRVRRAQARLRLVAPAARAILFRCTDAEIAALAALPGEPAAVSAWLAERQAAELRWRVTLHRFPPAVRA